MGTEPTWPPVVCLEPAAGPGPSHTHLGHLTGHSAIVINGQLACLLAEPHQIPPWAFSPYAQCVSCSQGKGPLESWRERFPSGGTNK